MRKLLLLAAPSPLLVAPPAVAAEDKAPTAPPSRS